MSPQEFFEINLKALQRNYDGNVENIKTHVVNAIIDKAKAISEYPENANHTYAYSFSSFSKYTNSKTLWILAINELKAEGYNVSVEYSHDYNESCFIVTHDPTPLTLKN